MIRQSWPLHPLRAMYLLSRLAGALSVLASLLLIFEFAGTPLIGGTEAHAPPYVRVMLIGLVVVASAIASVKFRRQSRLETVRPHRLIFVEGIVFTLVGGFLLVGGVVWLHLSGGAYGLHLIAFLLGGSLTLTGLGRLGTGTDRSPSPPRSSFEPVDGIHGALNSPEPDAHTMDPPNERR